jgi:hypothetical protein
MFDSLDTFDKLSDSDIQVLAVAAATLSAVLISRVNNALVQGRDVEDYLHTVKCAEQVWEAAHHLHNTWIDHVHQYGDN